MNFLFYYLTNEIVFWYLPENLLPIKLFSFKSEYLVAFYRFISARSGSAVP